MKFLILLFSLISLTYFAVADDEDEHVLTLTQENFESTITDNEMVLVKFYAPWCGHCKSFAPEYEKAAKMLTEEGSKIKLGKVDATVHTEIASKYKIQGYPTMKFFKKGEPLEYNGPRMAEGVVSWLKKKTGPPMVKISSKAEFEKLKTENQVLAVIHSIEELAKEYTAISEFASKADSLTFVHVEDKPLANELGLTDDAASKLVLFKHFDDPIVHFKGAFEHDELDKFVKMEKVPLVTEFTQETAQVVFESDIKIHIIAFSGKKSSEYEKHMGLLKSVAIKLKGKCHVVIIDMDDAEIQRVGEFFGVTATDVPTFRVLKMGDEMVKYHPEKKDFTAEYLESFTKDVLDGKVKAHLKSQDEPEDWDKEPVKVLVAKTFKDRAVSKDKAVFIEFYAPWCGHCKALIPTWEELAKEYEGKSEVLIAKCDATENEFEDLKIASFPTLKFSPKGSDEWVDYSGERNKEAFMKFIDANGKVEKEDQAESKEDEKHDEL